MNNGISRTITPNPPADFTPSMGNYKSLQPFRYWCQKVLPLVYDDSLSYYELLCKVVDYLNKTMQDVETLHGDVTELNKAYEQLQGYVNNYFSTLDVQEEINHKLDTMVENGTLYDLLKNAFHAGSSPKFVESVAQMTDKYTIYILLPDGYMYYWNGTSFVNTGMKYSESEYSIINNNKAITKYNYTELLPDLNNANASTYYLLNFPLNSTEIPLNTPFENKWSVNSVCVLLTLLPDYNQGGVQIFQTPINIYMRIRGTETWTEWQNLLDLEDKNYIEQYPTLIGSYNYNEILPDLNNVFEAKYYVINIANGSSDIPLNTPFGDTWKSNSICVLLTYPVKTKLGSVQIFQTSNNSYMRVMGRETWGEWQNLFDLEEKNYIEQYPTLIGSYNYNEILPDLNNVFEAKYYVINIANGSSDIPLNTPFSDTWKSNTPCVLLTYPVKTKLGSMQYFISDTSVYTRIYSTHWSKWTEFINTTISNKTLYVGDGGIPSLTDAIMDNDKLDTVIYVQDGVYDLEAEFKAKYGENFFTDFNAGSRKGLILDNNVKIICSNKAIIKFDYKGDNPLVKQLFSPLNSGMHGFELINATVIASNCRYCVHDERGYSEDFYKNAYEKCTFIMDNSGNTDWASKACIGGGLGKNGLITINGCILDSVGADDNYGILSYHNNTPPNSKSKLLITNNYLKKGTIRLASHGTSEEISTMIVGNNKINGNYIVTKETSDDTIVNVELLNLNS